MRIKVCVEINNIGEVRLKTQKSADKMMISLAPELSTVKMSASQRLDFKAVEIDEDGMHIEIDLIKQDIKVLLHLAMVGSEICSVETFIVHLVYCLITPVFGIKCSSILYHKSFPPFSSNSCSNLCGHYHT